MYGQFDRKCQVQVNTTNRNHIHLNVEVSVTVDTNPIVRFNLEGDWELALVAGHTRQVAGVTSPTKLWP